MADLKTVARPYAQAVFDVAQENDALAELSASLLAAKQLVADGTLVEFLANPRLNDAKRLEILEDLFGKLVGPGSVFAGGSRHGRNFIRLLLENDRVDALPEISDRFEVLKARTENKVDVTVTSATELSEAQVAEMAAALRQRLGRNVSIETKTDKRLIGGAIISAGDVVIDGSTRARLEGLANALIK